MYELIIKAEKLSYLLGRTAFYKNILKFCDVWYI